MTRDELLSRLGMMSQDTWLFGGTIRDNIAYGRPVEQGNHALLLAAGGAYAALDEAQFAAPVADV